MSIHIHQLATIRITCNGNTGTAVIFFPSENTNDVYILTAKHCLLGEYFDKKFVKQDILLDRIFNSIDETYHSYQLTETDVVITSIDALDLALLILPKQRIVELIGNTFYYQVIDTDVLIVDYIIRGFANFNNQKIERPYPLKFIEDQKDSKNHFVMKSDQQLDTYYQQALENVEGLSGSGAFTTFNNKVYLVGIVHSYESGNLFIATKVSAFNQLIPPGKFERISPVKLELNEAVLNSFNEIDKNLDISKSQIRDTVGTVNVPRSTKNLLKFIKDSRLTVIHGRPGVGKSVLAKACTEELKKNGATILALTAEHLYSQTLSESLTKAGYSVSLEQILGSPLIGNRVLVWIESFEKLLESGQEGAFNDLLSMMRKRSQISVIVTVRDYLLQKFKITYQFELPEQIEFYPVSEFNDEEISKIREAIPGLGPLLDNEKIHHLLRTPYYLDKAARIIPQLSNESQLDEFAFKSLMWQHIIEGGNSQRAASFSAICLKRAREMSLFTRSDEPKSVIDDLVRDNILQVDNSELADGYSPSHDILEDWALIRFIREQYRDSSSPKTFITNLETSPAIRRAFRLWLDEFYKKEPEISASFVHSLILDPDLAQTWKDELLVASLRSNHATSLIYALKSLLLANKGSFLEHVIQLLKTGCKTIDPKSHNFERLLPVGSGWDVIIVFIKDNIEIIDGFGTFEPQYLSVIEGWSKQLPDFGIKTLPPAAESAAVLLKNYIQNYQGEIYEYRRRKSIISSLRPFAAILFKLTGAIPELVRELMKAARDPETQNENWTNEAILEAVRGYMIDGVMSDQLCKYFPDDVMYVASQEWLEKPEINQLGGRMAMFRRQADWNDFGLEEYIDQRYDFPSGYQTFFYWMFLHHPDKALDFIIPFLNNAFERNQQVLTSLDDEINQITIEFPDGVSQTYYANNRYWGMYRGFHSANTLISSLLMGLEAGILDMVDQGDLQHHVVTSYIVRLIRETNNVAVLGVVISVLQANPALLDKTSIPLFGVPQFFRWDGHRSNSEMTSSISYFDDSFQKQERKKSNHRLHRRKYYLGMVGFVADYMFYHRTHNDLLFREIDSMWGSATEDDQLWRKFLFDMDARKYGFKPVEIAGYENMVQLVPGYDNEVKETILSRGDLLGVLPPCDTMWAIKAFAGEKMVGKTYEVWKSGYSFLQSIQGESNFMTAPGTMATIGLRDFYEQMQPDEIVWCREELLRQGEGKLRQTDRYGGNFNVLDENPTMRGISFVFKGEPEEHIQVRARDMIFRLLIHGMYDQPKFQLEAGLAHHLYQFQPSFVINCWYALLKIIEFRKSQNIANDLLEEYWLEDQADPIDPNQQKVDFETWKDQLVISVVKGSITPPEQIKAILDMPTHRYQDDALRIIPYNTNLDAHHDFIQQLLILHIAYLNDSRHRNTSDFYDSRHAFTFFYARYLLNQSQERAQILFKELLDLILIPQESKKETKVIQFLYDLVKEHIRAVNEGNSLNRFWLLWEYLRDWIILHKNAFLFPLLLMEIEWTEDSDNWHVLEGKNLFYKSFILEWGFNLINTSIKFLGGIAFNKFMPDSINWVASMVDSQNAKKVDLSVADKFIEKAFYKYGSKIKGDRNVLNNFLFILEFLITKESSKAYMLKEELIQYK